MITRVTQKNMVTIPAAISRQFSITPGCRMDWRAVEGAPDQIRVKVIPKRGNLAQRLKGSGKLYSPERDAVSELVHRDDHIRRIPEDVLACLDLERAPRK